MRDQRVLLGLNQEELGDLLGVTRHYIGRIENGKMPSRKMEEKIERWLREQALRIGRGDRFPAQYDAVTERSKTMVMERREGDDEDDSMNDRVAVLARRVGVDSTVLMRGLIDAAERELERSGGLMFPLRLATSTGKQSTSAGENG